MAHKYLNKPRNISVHSLSIPPTYGLQHYTHKHQLVGELFDRLSRTKNDKPHRTVPQNERTTTDQTQESTCLAAPLAAPPSPQPRALSAISAAARLRSGRRTKDAVCPLAFSSLPIWSGRPGYLEPKHLCAPPNKNTFLSSTLTCGFFELSR